MALTKSAAVAYLSSLARETDGLPAVDLDRGAFESAVMAAESADAIAGFFAWSRKVEAAIKASRGSGPCPITAEQFARLAPELTLQVFGQSVKTLKKHGKPRINAKTGELSGGAFKSGGFGYWIGGRVTLPINGHDVAFMLGGQLVAVNSGNGKAPVESAPDGDGSDAVESSAAPVESA